MSCNGKALIYSDLDTRKLDGTLEIRACEKSHAYGECFL